MKITPLEIRQHTFEKSMRGYNKDEVHAYLLSLSQEWEKMNDENKTLKIELERTMKDVEKLREVESSLFKTLKTAEDTGINMVQQAKKESELMMKETQMNSDAIMNEARDQAKNIIEEAEEKSRNTLLGMRDELQKLGSQYRSLINDKENLLLDMRNIANSLLEKADRFSKSSNNNFDKSHKSVIKEIVAIEKEVKEIPSPEIELSVEPSTITPSNTDVDNFEHTNNDTEIELKATPTSTNTSTPPSTPITDTTVSPSTPQNITETVKPSLANETENTQIKKEEKTITEELKTNIESISDSNLTKENNPIVSSNTNTSKTETDIPKKNTANIDELKIANGGVLNPSHEKNKRGQTSFFDSLED